MLTISELEQIFYNLTYENGVTFGMCGNASAEMKLSLLRAINNAVCYNTNDKYKQ